MIDSLTDIDTSIFLFFNNTVRLSWLDTFMMMFSGRFIWIPMYVSLLYIMIRSLPPRLVIIYVLAIILAITMSDQTCATIIRPIVARMRPSNPDNPLSALTIIVNEYRGGPNGFPSCHAANSFALAIFSSLLLRRRNFTIFIVSWAIFNSYTRIHLGVHYPGDLMVGALIGSICGWLCYRIGYIFTTPHIRKETTRRLNTAVFTRQVTSSRTFTLKLGDVMIAAGIITIIYIIIASMIIH